MGLALESVVGVWDEEGGRAVALVEEWQLEALVERANERFVENEGRIARFRALLGGGGEREVRVWESREDRGRRMREEGLARKREAKGVSDLNGDRDLDIDLGVLDENQG